MSKVYVELNEDEVRNLLKSQEVADFLEDRANKIIKRTHGNYKTSTYVGANRVNVSIFTEDSHTLYDNRKNNTLLKGLRG